ncbi:Signal peptidase I W [uncultured Roseburia sp.]|uniref:Signal peptidase I n=1 Tax=Brotonthovivens ammoniilytica TaxID=2981725 RepID=A0ABT2TFQ1_9FIRM|nr:signal peptidase I [Brotonthovivens ammoniilytica]MCU6761023.1 signal peptidase I [Brotonthovivens ammoniilytica]SCI16601.1 Signal peptidase I W [uncultured Roseburia sp.]
MVTKLLKFTGKFFLFSVTGFLLFLLLLHLSGFKSYYVLSGSMEPEIKTGSMVIVNTNADNFQIGDIICYQLSDTRVTHRILSITSKDSFITKGDANEAQDFFPVNRNMIIGKAVFHIPYLGYLFQMISEILTFK